MSYQYQIDYGNGYEDVSADDAVEQGQANAASWLAEAEREPSARRARVLSGGQVIEERDFGCVVVESRLQPDGSTRHLVQCSSGDVIVEEQPGGTLSGAPRAGYVGNADRALERAFEAVRELRERG